MSGHLARRWVASALVVGGMLMIAALDAWADEVKADALLSIDQNRSTVIERIVGDWGAPLAQSSAGITGTQLRTMLEGLRADHLLAASLAGSVDGLRDVLANSQSSSAPARTTVAVKALGDAAQDLSYTPVSPCRLFDTRPSQGGLGTMVPSVRRTYGATAPVASQGGPGGCTAGAGAAVALIQIGTVAPAGSGLLQGGPQGVGSFPNALILYQAGDQYGTAVAMPLNAANGQFDLQVLFAGTDLYADLLGYFKAPSGGFVSSVATGAGLTGGPITGSGTISIATGGVGTAQLADGSVTTPKIADAGVTTPKIADAGVTAAKLASNGCASGQILKYDGANWSCAADATGSGTVTTVNSGSGLTGGPITAAGTLSVASGGVTAAMLASNGCTSGQILKYDGANWSCAADATGSGGTVTSVGAGVGLSGGPITTSGTISIANGGVGVVQLANGAVDVTKLDTASTDARYFRQGGNAFAGTAVLGTTDNNAIEFDANGIRLMRLEPNVVSPNMIGGHPTNSVSGSSFGQTVGGGGAGGTTCNDQPTGTSTRPCGNRALNNHATVGGGLANLASGLDATVGGGVGNTASSSFSTVGGGGSNIASGSSSTVGGGATQVASGINSTVGGGASNIANNAYSTVGGGLSNTAGEQTTTVGGGAYNTASNVNSTIGGGILNAASGYDGTVGGGEHNTASGFDSTVGGGGFNVASGGSATVGGGASNTASSQSSTVAGGDTNVASGQYSMVAGGFSNTASGNFSFVAGRQAKAQTAGAAPTQGVFVFADSKALDFNTLTQDEFAVRATGGVRFVLAVDLVTGAPTWTCAASSGSSWACSSDRNLKQNFDRLDGRRVLEQLAAMPIYAWNPKGVNAKIRHYGPTAQDFYATFGLGDSEVMIGQQDADGVALAAIQGLNAKQDERDAMLTRIVQEKDAEIADLRAKASAQERDLAELRRAVDILVARSASDRNFARAD